MMNEKYKDCVTSPRKGGRSYIYYGQAVPPTWTITNTNTGKTFKNKEELDASMNKPKRAPRKKKVAA